MIAYHCPVHAATHRIEGAIAFHIPRLRAVVDHAEAIRAMRGAGLHVDAGKEVWRFGAAWAFVEAHCGCGVQVVQEEP